MFVFCQNIFSLHLKCELCFLPQDMPSTMEGWLVGDSGLIQINHNPSLFFFFTTVLVSIVMLSSACCFLHLCDHHVFLEKAWSYFLALERQLSHTIRQTAEGKPASEQTARRQRNEKETAQGYGPSEAVWMFNEPRSGPQGPSCWVRQEWRTVTGPEWAINHTAAELQ